MYILVKLAWRNMWLHKLRTILTIVSITLGVAVLMSVRTANANSLHAIQALFNETAGKSSLTVESAIASRQAAIGFSSDLVEQIQALPGVVRAVPYVNAQTVYQGKRTVTSLAVQGIDILTDPQVRSYSLVEGNFPTQADRGYSAVLVSEFAQRQGIHVGQEIELLVPGGTESFRVVGIISQKGAGLSNGGQVVFMPLPVAQQVFARGHRIDSVSVVADSEIAESPTKLAALKDQVQAALGEGYTVMYPAEKGASLTEALSGIQYGLALFGLFALFASALLIYNTFAMETAERVREIGLLRTLGTGHSQIMIELLSSALLLSLIGSVLGLILGFILAVPLLQMYASMTGYQLEGAWPALADIMWSFFLGLGVTLLSALLPVVQASRLAPMEAVRVRAQNPEGLLGRWSWAIGLVLLAIWGASFFIPALSGSPMFLFLFAGATLILPAIIQFLGHMSHGPVTALYGYEGSLGTTNLARSRGRTSTTVAVLMVGIAMSISVGSISDSLVSGVRTWIDSVLKVDLFVSSYAPMNITWQKRLQGIQDVEIVSPVRVLHVPAQDPQRANRRFDIRLEAIDPTTQAQIGPLLYASGQGNPADLWNRFKEGGSVLVSTQIADAYNLHQGDTLRVWTARGMQELPITAVIVDYNSMRGTVKMTWADLNRFFGLMDVDVFMLKLSPGADVQTVRQRIESQYGKGGQLSFQTRSEARTSILESIGSVMLAFNGLTLIAFVIAAIAIVNTMTMNILERTRELGLLRAVGMTPFQVSKMVLAETLVMGFVAVLFGLALGVVFSRVAIWWMAAGAGYRVDYVLPLAALVTSCILALGISQLAALVPARRIFRFSILDALRTE